MPVKRTPFSPRYKLVFALVLAVVVLLAGAACNGGDGPAPTATVSEDFRLVAERAAKEGLLTLNDLPGWTSSPAGTEEEPPLGLSEQCRSFEEDNFQFEGEIAEEESDDFIGPRKQEASSSITVFANREDSQRAINQIDDLFSRCRNELVRVLENVLRESFREGGVEGLVQDVKVFFDRISFPKLGDQTLAYRFGFSARVLGQAVEFNGDIVGIRAGRVIGGLFYSAEGQLDTAEKERLARIIADKLRKADDSLPD